MSIPHKSFLGILCYMLFSIILRSGFGNKKIDTFSTILQKRDSDSNNVIPVAFAQVATPTMTQLLVMPTSVPISVSLGEKSEKFNGLNFKRWQ